MNPIIFVLVSLCNFFKVTTLPCEPADQNRRDNEEDSGDEWVNHSDMEDDLDEINNK